MAMTTTTKYALIGAGSIALLGTVTVLAKRRARAAGLPPGSPIGPQVTWTPDEAPAPEPSGGGSRRTDERHVIRRVQATMNAIAGRSSGNITALRADCITSTNDRGIGMLSTDGIWGICSASRYAQIAAAHPGVNPPLPTYSNQGTWTQVANRLERVLAATVETQSAFSRFF